MYGSALRALFAVLACFLALLGAETGSRAAADRGTRQSVTCIFDHTMLRTPPGVCRPRAVSYPPHVAGRVKRAIYDSALTFGVPYPTLLGIARCESGLNPRARNAGHYGLFQFLPTTFHTGARSMRRATGITAHSYWKPADAAYVAGYLFAVGEAPRWGCLYASPG